MLNVSIWYKEKSEFWYNKAIHDWLYAHNIYINLTFCPEDTWKYSGVFQAVWT